MTIFDRKKLYLFFYPLVIAEEILRRSHYCDFPIFKYLCLVVLVIACLFAALKLGLDVYQRKVSNRKILIICTGTLYCVFLLLRKQTDAFMVLWLFIVAGHDVDYGRQMKTAAFSMIAAVAFVVVSGLLGVIDNTSVIRTRDEIEYLRNALGFMAPYQAAYFLFFATLAWVYHRKERLSWYEILTLAVVNYVVFWQSDTRGPYYLSMILLSIVIVLKFFPQLRRYQKCYTVLTILIPVVCAAVIIIQGAFIDPNSSEFMRELNNSLTDRLRLNYEGVHTYGISFFGKSIEWYIGNEPVWNPYKPYNWVDSVYLYSLLSYGVPFMLGFFAITTKLALAAGRKKDTYMVIALVLIAILGLWDNYCFRIECNPFYLFFAYEASVSVAERPLEVGKDEICKKCA